MNSDVSRHAWAFDKLKAILSVEGFLCVSFAVFMAGFYLSPTWKAMNIYFYLFIAVPFIVLRGRALLNGVLENSAVLVGNLFIIYFTVSHFWVVGEPVFRTTKVLGMGLCTLLFFNISYYAVRRNYQRLFAPVVVLSAGVMVFSSLVIFYGENPFPTTRLRSVINGMHPIWVAQLLGFALLLILAEVRTEKHISWKATCVCIALVCVIGILLTHSRSVMISLPVTLFLVMLAFGLRFSIYIVAAGIACVFVYWCFDNTAFDKLIARGLASRDAIWAHQIARLGENWWFGLGLSANDDVQFTSGFRALHTHSIYVGVLYYGGIVGAALFLAFIGVAIGRSISLSALRSNWLPYSLVLFGLISFIVEGEKLVRMVGTEWVLFWFPVAYLLAAKKKYDSEESSETALQVEDN